MFRTLIILTVIQRFRKQKTDIALQKFTWSKVDLEETANPYFLLDNSKNVQFKVPLSIGYGNFEIFCYLKVIYLRLIII